MKNNNNYFIMMDSRNNILKIPCSKFNMFDFYNSNTEAKENCIFAKSVAVFRKAAGDYVKGIDIFSEEYKKTLDNV